ncbi:MAG TPA: hypothetical protein DEP57_10180 [Selenomonas sp.]|nr:hypothetical protein [Selenomonas sp.]
MGCFQCSSRIQSGYSTRILISEIDAAAFTQECICGFSMYFVEIGFDCNCPGEVINSGKIRNLSDSFIQCTCIFAFRKIHSFQKFSGSIELYRHFFSSSLFERISFSDPAKHSE